jgi:hypothetical protein
MPGLIRGKTTAVAERSRQDPRHCERGEAIKLCAGEFWMLRGLAPRNDGKLLLTQ